MKGVLRQPGGLSRKQKAKRPKQKGKSLVLSAFCFQHFPAFLLILAP